jgi:hypothetical protein
MDDIAGEDADASARGPADVAGFGELRVAGNLLCNQGRPTGFGKIHDRGEEGVIRRAVVVALVVRIEVRLMARGWRLAMRPYFADLCVLDLRSYW